MLVVAHLIEHDAEGKHVALGRVGSVAQKFWGELGGSALEAREILAEVVIDSSFGKSEVAEYELVVLGEEDIAWLDVSVQNVLRVK